VHVILGTDRKTATFLNSKLAEAVIEIVGGHPETLAACLMPDHLHWLLKDAAQMLQTVHRVKSYSTQVAWKLGHRGKLWQRSFWDHVIRKGESLEDVIAYILGHPVRAGLVESVDEYPYQVAPLGGAR